MSARSEAERLLEDLLAAGAIPTIRGGRLEIDAPPGVMTAARREALPGSLPEVRALVAARWRSREQCVARRPCRVNSICVRPIEGRPCLVPATCCVRGEPLPSGRRYLCPDCSERGTNQQEQSNLDGGIRS